MWYYESDSRGFWEAPNRGVYPSKTHYIVNDELMDRIEVASKADGLALASKKNKEALDAELKRAAFCVDLD